MDEVVIEVPDRAGHGNRRASSETAERSVVHDLRQTVDLLEGFHRTISVGNVRNEIKESRGSLPARSTFAAAFLLKEVGIVADNVDDAVGVVNNDYGSAAQPAAGVRNAVDVKDHVNLICVDIGSRSAAGLNRQKTMAVLDSAAVVKDKNFLNVFIVCIIWIFITW